MIVNDFTYFPKPKLNLNYFLQNPNQFHPVDSPKSWLKRRLFLELRGSVLEIGEDCDDNSRICDVLN